MDNDLINTQWREFVIGDLFSIKIGKNIDGNKVNKNFGNHLYVTRKEVNNGIDGVINGKNDYLNSNVPAITIGNETATAFVQVTPFFTGTKINILNSKVKLSKYALLFIAQCLNTHKDSFSYSYTINSTRLRRQKVLLPATSSGEPDYAFMEHYMLDLERSKINEYICYLEQRLSKVCNVFDELTLKNVVWGEFKIDSLFKLTQGKSKGLNHLKQTINGRTNYLGATNLNNGVLSFVEEEKQLIQKGNCIAFIRNGEGSMGFSVYKQEDFIATSDMTIGYNKHLNRYSGTFITTVADQVRGKYNFGYKRNGTRLANEKILLPTTPTGEPDYVFMEQYMLNIEMQKLQEYRDYISRSCL